MIFAIIFFIFAAFFFWAGDACFSSEYPLLWVAGILFYWAAVAEAVTGSLYLLASLFRVNPGWNFKDHRGKVVFSSRLFAWPYLYFERRAWKRYRERTKEPLLEEVRDGLFIGARPTTDDLHLLRENNINTVLDMVAEFEDPEELREEMKYLSVPVMDGTAPSDTDLFEGAKFAADAVAAGNRVLVHCTFGHGRSATACAGALLMLGDAASVEDAINILKRCKRRIWITRDQKKALDRSLTKPNVIAKQKEEKE